MKNKIKKIPEDRNIFTGFFYALPLPFLGGILFLARISKIKAIAIKNKAIEQVHHAEQIAGN